MRRHAHIRFGRSVVRLPEHWAFACKELGVNEKFGVEEYGDGVWAGLSDPLVALTEAQ